MTATVPTGSIITYSSGDWYSGWFSSAIDTINAVGQLLVSNDGMKIRKVNSVSVNGIVSAVDKYLGGPAKFSVELEIEITGGLGFNSVDDVAAVVNHEAYQATGKLPAISSVPKVSIPGTPSITGFIDWVKSLFSGTQSTGQPSSTGSGFSLSSLTSSGTLYIGLAVFGFVAALALIGYSGALKRSGPAV